MSDINAGFDQPRHSEEASLGDVLELVRTLEDACAENDRSDPDDPLRKVREISPRERILIGYYPDEPEMEEDGNVIGHIVLSEKQSDGRYRATISYKFIREPGNETTTKIIAFGTHGSTLKDIFGDRDPNSVEGKMAAEVNIVAAELGISPSHQRRKGRYIPYKDEVVNLKKQIATQYLSPKQ